MEQLTLTFILAMIRNTEAHTIEEKELKDVLLNPNITIGQLQDHYSRVQKQTQHTPERDRLMKIAEGFARLDYKRLSTLSLEGT